jgi:hypothetical protein
MQKRQNSSNEQHKIQEEKSTKEVNSAYWHKRLASKAKGSIAREKQEKLWVESTTVPDIEISKYTYPSPTAVLEIMLKEMAIQDAERYAEYLSQPTEFAAKLKGLLRNEALAVLNGGEFDRVK